MAAVDTSPRDVVEPASAAPPARQGGRLAFLDVLRGIAVLLVVVQHVGELRWPWLHRVTRDSFSLGQFGVMIFFLCSGFIIPATLERREAYAGALDLHGRLREFRRFWINRFFRLYPLYWLSLAMALAVMATGIGVGTWSLTTRDWLANLTMVQSALGSPHAIGLYWTLSYELVFYGLLSCLFVVALHRRSLALAVGMNLLCVAAAVAADRIGLVNLVAMFTGTVCFRWYGRTVSLRAFAAYLVFAAACTSISAYAAVWGHPPAPENFTALLCAWLAAYVVFLTVLGLRHRAQPRLLQRLGVISYSVYLVHGVAVVAIAPFAGAVVTAATQVVIVVAVSALTYRVVERPGMRLGHRLSAASA